MLHTKEASRKPFHTFGKLLKGSVLRCTVQLHHQHQNPTASAPKGFFRAVRKRGTWWDTAFSRSRQRLDGYRWSFETCLWLDASGAPKLCLLSISMVQRVFETHLAVCLHWFKSSSQRKALRRVECCYFGLTVKMQACVSESHWPHEWFLHLKTGTVLAKKKNWEASCLLFFHFAFTNY